MGHQWNDTLDHVIAAALAAVIGIGMFILQLQQGSVPDWAIAALGTVLGFYFRGRVNGQYNRSQMSELEKQRKEEA